jgi:hypothetical protein
MITLVARKEITEKYIIITSELSKIQNAIFDKDTLQDYEDDNEGDLYKSYFDCIGYQSPSYKVNNKIISLNYSDIETFSSALSKKLMELFQIIKATRFIVISGLKLDFFGNRKNSYKPLKKAYKKLEEIVESKSFREAFTIEIEDIPTFAEILFWIARCDPSAPAYIFLFDEAQQIQMNLCKYGNIHLKEINGEYFTKDVLDQFAWTIIDGKEFDNFTEDGEIDGRKMKL